MFKFVALFLFIAQVTFAQSLEFDLKQAIITGDVETVKVIVNTTDVNIEEQDLFDDTPLRLSIEKSQLEIASLLLENGADVENSGKYDTPLKYAIKYGNLEMIQLLINSGADINNADDGFYPLHLAIFSQNPTLVKLILDAKPDILNTNGGFSFLEYATSGSRWPNWEIIEMIKEATDKALRERLSN